MGFIHLFVAYDQSITWSKYAGPGEPGQIGGTVVQEISQDGRDERYGKVK
jgi:hypothetical protein